MKRLQKLTPEQSAEVLAAPFKAINAIFAAAAPASEREYTDESRYDWREMMRDEEREEMRRAVRYERGY